MSWTDEAYPTGLTPQGGLTKREETAIRVRRPVSGDSNIDAALAQAERRDLAAAILGHRVALLGVDVRWGYSVREGEPSAAQRMARESLALADALLAELGG